MTRTRGSSARNGGHGFECTSALYLAEQVFGFTGTLIDRDEHGRLLCPVQTTRAVVKSSKGDIATRNHGSWAPWFRFPDRTFPNGQRWALECKSYGDGEFPKRSLIAEWLEQADLNLRVDLDGEGCTAVIVDRKYQPTGASWVFLPDRRGGPDPYRVITLDQLIAKEF